MIPWFPGGHADPWNHVEAAMALALGGRRAEAERAYEWLVDLQRPDGSWHQYYLEDAIEQDKLDANVIAYVATGVWHHYLLFGDDGFVEAMWPTVEAAIDFVLDLQTPARRDPLGPPRRRHAVVVRPAHRLVEHLPQPALRHRPGRAPRPRAPRLGAQRRPPGPRDRRPHRRRAARRLRPQAPLGHGLVLPGPDRRARRRAPASSGSRRAATRSWSRAWACAASAIARGSPPPRPASACWPTSASGERDTALDLFRWAQQLRDDDGHYWTGIVFPDMVHFPGNERSTYTAASIVLAADALAGASPASQLFVDHDALPALIDTDHEDVAAGPRRD